MSMFLAWIAYPLVLAALCAGVGLAVDLFSGRRLPGALVLPVGLAAIVVVGQFTTWSGATAELTVPAILAVAVLGAGLSLPWRYARPGLWPIVAVLAVFCAFAAPIVLSGHPTFPGYVKLDDTATWFALTDRVMEHGRDLSGLEPSTYLATLRFNLADGYPVGVFIPFGAAQKLVGGDLAWVFSPYLSFFAAMLSLCLWEVFGALLRRPGPRALAVFLAAQPALLYGYAMWGGVKELAAAAFVALAAALAPGALRPCGRARDVLALAIATAALIGVLSPGGLLWVAPILLALAVLAWRRLGPREALLRAALFAALVGLLALPVLASGLVPPTSSPLTDAHAQGNLVGPLNPLQALGIWPAGDFRFDPGSTVATAVLVGFGLLAALLGLWAAWRRRAESALLYASALLVAAAIVLIGSPWAGGKALATASPILLSLAVLGAFAALRVDRFAGGLLLAAVAGGVLWSNVLAYGGAGLAPYGQLRELEQIGERFAGQGPALMTGYNPYGARHFLRRLDAEGASELRSREVPLADGGIAPKGYTVDTDELDQSGLLIYRTLVLRRSPVRSRPPAPYRLVSAGDYYEVWQRPQNFAGPLPEFLALGSPLQPVAVPRCSEVIGLGQPALLHGARGVSMIAARHAPVYEAGDGRLDLPRAARYTAWLQGSVRGSVELRVDGAEVGQARHQLENEGGFVELGSTRLDAGAHRVELRFGGADLHPGSGGFPRPATGPLLFAPADDEAGALVSVPIEQADRLCGRPWDWVEAVGGG
jgi:hypothetical protein